MSEINESTTVVTTKLFFLNVTCSNLDSQCTCIQDGPSKWKPQGQSPMYFQHLRIPSGCALCFSVCLVLPATPNEPLEMQDAIWWLDLSLVIISPVTSWGQRSDLACPLSIFLSNDYCIANPRLKKKTQFLCCGYLYILLELLFSSFEQSISWLSQESLSQNFLIYSASFLF